MFGYIPGIEHLVVIMIVYDYVDVYIILRILAGVVGVTTELLVRRHIHVEDGRLGGEHARRGSG